MTNANRLTRSEFAELCGVSRAAITRAVQGGRLHVDSAGCLKKDDPENAAFIARRRAKPIPPVDDVDTVSANSPPTMPHVGALPIVDDGDEYLDAESAVIQRTKRAEMEIKENKRDKSHFDLERQKKNLITREECERAIGESGTLTQQYVMGLPDAIGDELVALAQAGDRGALDRFFFDACDRVCRSVANGVEKITRELSRDE